MTLTEQLQTRIQDVADLGGKFGREDDFASRYSTLLAELTEAMQLMRNLAILQGGWLQAQAQQRGRTN